MERAADDRLSGNGGDGFDGPVALPPGFSDFDGGSGNDRVTGIAISF